MAPLADARSVSVRCRGKSGRGTPGFWFPKAVPASNVRQLPRCRVRSLRRAVVGGIGLCGLPFELIEGLPAERGGCQSEQQGDAPKSKFFHHRLFFRLRSLHVFEQFRRIEPELAGHLVKRHFRDFDLFFAPAHPGCHVARQGGVLQSFRECGIDPQCAERAVEADGQRARS